MHESGLVAAIVTEAQRHASPEEQRVTMLRLRIGALAAVSPEALRTGILERTTAAWGEAPEIEIESDSDPSTAGALWVTLVAVGVG